MTRTQRRALWTVGAVLIVLGSGLAALGVWWPRAPQEALPENVPPSWATYRTSPGHQQHVARDHIACSACHAIEQGGFANPGTAVCRTCHAKEAAVMHKGGPGADATVCTSCHAFQPDAPAATCIGCHAKPHGAVPAVVQHSTTDCGKCHRAHESPPIAADCTDCHEERAAGHAAHTGSAGCADCHRGHAPAAAALTLCSSCHAQPAGPRPAGHDSCTGCHRPHDFAAGAERACIGCHGEKATLVATQVPAHGVCTSCHAPHDPAGAASSCVTCHANMQVAHGKAGDCVTCHVPHAQEPRPVALECSSCHRRVAAFETGAHTGGIACEACHKPHGFAALDPRTICQNCHAREMALVASNAGHQDCQACHGSSLAHAPAAAPPCGSCHVNEQATAPAGHRQCQGCHDPHAGEPTPACASCHQSKTGGPHQGIAGGCDTCHRPHGPGGTSTPPTCVTCHARTSLPALHAASGHADCASCHASSHEAPRDDRATCTGGSCHQDRRNHQPQAQVCSGCHVFRR